jgi:phosphotriesterase-related protein
MIEDQGTPYAMTVLGPIPPEDLGLTLTHEHLYIDTTAGYHASASQSTDQDLDPTRRLSWATAAEARWDGRGFPLNVRLTDIDLVVDELAWFRESGGQSICDVTPITLTRNPEALAEISRRAGINVVMGGSFYTERAHPSWLASRSVEDIAAAFISEIREGVGQSGIRPGIMGEIGTSEPMTAAEARVLRAHALAQQETGVALTIHQAPWAREGHAILDVLQSTGADLTRVVLGHVMAIDNTQYQKSLLDRGVVLSYDYLGSDHAIFTYGMDVPPGRYPPNDYDVLQVVASLVEEGYTKQLLLSGDIGERLRLRAYGGWGYGHIPRHIVPLMLAIGIDETALKTILVGNPRRILSIRP